MSVATAVSAKSYLPTLRSAAWIGLCGAETLAISLVHEVPYDGPNWQSPVLYIRLAAIWALCACVCFLLISWDKRSDLARLWRTAQRSHNWQAPLLLNLALFAATVTAAMLVTIRSAKGAVPSSFWLGGYSLLIVATLVSLIRLDVPIRALLNIASRYRANFAAAAIAGLVVEFVSYLAQSGWSALAGATLQLTGAILGLYEPNVLVNEAEYSIQVGDFKVRVLESCSGYEGIGLVTAFLAIFLWVFRSSLRFPHAFLLFPIGLISIWIFNSIRIAALVSIGAHLAPQVAIQGFHSQGGWITFLLVTISIMVLARRSTYLARVTSRRPATSSGSSVTAYLVPFCALMMSSVILAAAAPNDPPLYPLKVVLVALAVWSYRHVYGSLLWGISLEAILAGLIVGTAWIATDPGPAEGAGLGPWLASQTAWGMIAWLGLRVLGSVLLVPLAEELAFRGFLYRWLVARDFESVPFGHFALIPLVVSSVMFGMLHQRWLAAGLSSVVFTFIMWRTRRLSSAIVAHAVANAMICVWAIGFGQWSLL